MEDSTRISQLLSTAAVTTGSPDGSVAPLHMCKCGRAPWRKGQRNCVYCNREANKKYRESLKAGWPGQARPWLRNGAR